MFLYKIIGERAAGARTIVLIEPDPAVVQEHIAAGYHVYAFHERRHDLEEAGVQFRDAPLDLPPARSLKHVLDTESWTLGYPLGEAVSVGDPAETPLEPPPYNSSIRLSRR
jgi:hypothetical protein